MLRLTSEKKWRRCLHVLTLRRSGSESMKPSSAVAIGGQGSGNGSSTENVEIEMNVGGAEAVDGQAQVADTEAAASIAERRQGSSTAALAPGMQQAPPNTNIYQRGDGSDASSRAIDIAVTEEMIWTRHAINVGWRRSPAKAEFEHHH